VDQLPTQRSLVWALAEGLKAERRQAMAAAAATLDIARLHTG
jgi:hypothetical protein